jgi:hypothetical protein
VVAVVSRYGEGGSAMEQFQSLIISLVCPASEHGLQHGTDARPGSHSRRLSQCMLLVESW